MVSRVFNGTALVGTVQRVHNGTGLVNLTEYVHDGTGLVQVYEPPVDGPVPVPAATTTGSGTSTATVVLPTGLAAGDLLAIVVNVRLASAAPTAAGWTAHTPAATSGQQTLRFLTRPVVDAADALALSGSTVTITPVGTPTRMVACALRITGPRIVDAVGGGAGTSSGTTRTIGPVTTNGANRLLIAAWSVNDSTVTITKDPAMTVVAQVNSGSSAASHQALVVAVQTIAVAGSTGTRAATLSASTTSAGQLLAVAPAYV